VKLQSWHKGTRVKSKKISEHRIGFISKSWEYHHSKNSKTTPAYHFIKVIRDIWPKIEKPAFLGISPMKYFKKIIF
jgi:hypothetical protein